MNNKNNKNNKGYATLFVIAIISVALSGILITSASSVKSNQKQAIAHTIHTKAKLKAWTAQEAIRQYLSALTPTELNSLTTGDLTMTGSGISGMSAKVTSITANDTTVCSGFNKIVVEIVGAYNNANATLQSILCVGTTTTTTSSTPSLISGLANNSPMQLTGKTTLTGGSTLNISNSVGKTITINGDVDIKDGTSIKDADIYTTGNLTQTSGGAFNSIFSEKNVSLISNTYGTSPSINKTLVSVKALGNIELQGDSMIVGTVQSNGTTNIHNMCGTITTVNSIGDLFIKNCPLVTTANSNGNIEMQGASVINSNSSKNTSYVWGGNRGWLTNAVSNGNFTVSGTAKNIYSTGDIIVNGIDNSSSIQNAYTLGNFSTYNGDINVTTINAAKNINIYGGNGTYISNNILAGGNWYDTSWINVTGSASGKIGGSITKGTGTRNLVSVPGFTPSITIPTVPTITPLTKTPIVQYYVNAKDYEASANYVFSWDGTYIKVKVQNISDPTGKLVNGNSYYLIPGSYFDGGSWTTYKNSSLLCPTSTFDKTNCTIIDGQGWLPWWSFVTFGYDTATKTFNVGYYDANGQRMVAPGILYFNGNVKFDNIKMYNTVIATGNITNQGPVNLYSSNWNANMTCNSPEFPKPTNLCSGTNLLGTSLGNIGYLAGSYSGTTLVGGNIKITSGATVNGAVIAADNLTGTGGATVTGFIVAASENGGQNTIDGGFTINIIASFGAYNNTNVPISYSTGSSSSSTTSDTTTMPATVKWIKYK